MKNAKIPLIRASNAWSSSGPPSSSTFQIFRKRRRGEIIWHANTYMNIYWEITNLDILFPCDETHNLLHVVAKVESTSVSSFNLLSALQLERNVLLDTFERYLAELWYDNIYITGKLNLCDNLDPLPFPPRARNSTNALSSICLMGLKSRVGFFEESRYITLFLLGMRTIKTQWKLHI